MPNPPPAVTASSATVPVAREFRIAPSLLSADFSRLRDEVQAIDAPDWGDLGRTREQAYLTHPVFNTYRSETAMLRYIRSLSDKDLANPIELTPVAPRRILVTGADGQVGRALRKTFPDAEFCNREEFDITDPPARPWRQYRAIINAAAYTDVDGAEDDRATAWRVNAGGPAALARIAAENNLTLVHLSSDYVFDGDTDRPYTEEDPITPASVYGQSKAAGDIAAATAPRHYIVRTGWVVGEGRNFVDTMRGLAEKGVQPQVVHDQKGRPTFASDLATGIAHLLTTTPEYGTYHLTGAGDEVGWDEVAMATFTALGRDPDNVHPVSSAQYFAGKRHAPRPSRSTLNTAKLEATGWSPRNWRVGLALYLL